MNEYNYDQEEPDKDWEAFKRILIFAVICILLAIGGCIKFLTN